MNRVRFTVRIYNNTTLSIEYINDVKKLFHIFKRNQCPERLINRVVKSYLDNAQNSNTSASLNDTSTIYFKLPFLSISNFNQRKVRMLAKTYYKNLNIKLAFSSFKVKNFISVKDCVPRSLRSCVVYKFSCAGCNSVYTGETSRIYPHECGVSTYLQIKLTFLNMQRVRVRVGMLVVRDVLRCWIRQAHTTA